MAQTHTHMHSSLGRCTNKKMMLSKTHDQPTNFFHKTATNSTSALLLMNNKNSSSSSSYSYSNFNQLWPKSAIRPPANTTMTTVNSITTATTSTLFPSSGFNYHYHTVAQEKLPKVNDSRLSPSEALRLRLPSFSSSALPFSVHHHQPVDAEARKNGRKTDTAFHLLSALFPTASGDGSSSSSSSKSVADERQEKRQSHRFQLSALSQSPKTSSGQVNAADSQLFAASDFSTDNDGAAAAATAVASTGRSLFSISTTAAVNDLAINFTVTSNASLATAASTNDSSSSSSSFSSPFSHSAHRPSALSSSPFNNNNSNNNSNSQRIADFLSSASSSSSGQQSAVEQGPSTTSFSTSLGQPFYYNLPLADYYYYYASSRQATTATQRKTDRLNSTPLNALITPTGDSETGITTTTTTSTSTNSTNELNSSSGSEVARAAFLPTPSYSSGTSLPTIS